MSNGHPPKLPNIGVPVETSATATLLMNIRAMTENLERSLMGVPSESYSQLIDGKLRQRNSGVESGSGNGQIEHPMPLLVPLNVIWNHHPVDALVV